MVHKLTHKDTDKLRQIIEQRAANDADVSPVVRDIIKEVKTKGDTALIGYTKRFDEVILSPGRLRFTKEEIDKGAAECDKQVYASLELAAERIRAYHEKQMPKSEQYTDAQGVTLGWKYSPLASVGLYVPGGKASYPSSVLMNAIPAKVAGVERIVMVVPTPANKINPAVLAAAKIAGIEEIYRVGGAQAIAALAHGTETIQPVDKIVGPGNAYVAEAKRQVFGTVGIDTIAGPSEILVVADNKNEPTWIAADLLSQAEHDELAQAILITNDAAFAEAVEREVQALLAIIPRREITSVSWKNHGVIITVDDFSNAIEMIEMIAPEHLELAMDDAEAFSKKIKRAGAIFLGRHTPEAIGDYIAGPSHVLPTSRAARFSSGLSVFDFITRTSIMGCSPVAAKALAEAGAILADAEGLPAHALSLRLRTK